MSLKTYFILFLISLLFFAAIATFVDSPGYMDADYYFTTGLQLAEGKGFSEPFIWNYLNPPDTITHPSHGFWQPLASIVTALGLRLARGFDFASAQWIFVLLSAFVPPLTAALAFQLNPKRDLALLAAGFALLSGYYLPAMVTTDIFPLYMLFGALFLMAFRLPNLWQRALAWGLLAGLMHLSRVDGMMWLVLGGLAITVQAWREKRKLFGALGILFLAYLAVMLPWFLRNLSVFGALTAPGSEKMLWLTYYDQLFAYPSKDLTLQSWLAAGFGEMLAARWWALRLNFGTILGVQGEVVLLPLILLGAYSLRADRRVQLGILAWTLTFLAMTFVFPFAGARGSFFHSGAALQPLWWALAAIGTEKAALWFSKWRKKSFNEARIFFQVSLIFVLLLFSGSLFWSRQIVADPLSSGDTARYEKIEAYLLARTDIQPQDAVIVANPPGYFLVSGRSAIVLPDGDVESLFALAARYQARYLILEPGGVTADLTYLLTETVPEAGLQKIGEVAGAKIFAIEAP